MHVDVVEPIKVECGSLGSFVTRYGRKNKIRCGVVVATDASAGHHTGELQFRLHNDNIRHYGKVDEDCPASGQ